MPTEARKRAVRCRAHAEECLQLAAKTADANAQAHYVLLAEEYQRVAIIEETFADNIEKADAPFPERRPD